MTRGEVWTGPEGGFAAQVAAYPGAETVTSCMQCGVCSGSCPMVGKMPETPRRVMAHILAGDRQRALGSETIWYCVSCYTCAVRCPQGVSLTDVMAALRSMARERAPRVSAAFYGTFAETIAATGRVDEARVAMRTGMARGPAAMVRLAPVGMGLMRRGRMHLRRPTPISGAGEVAALLRAVEARSPSRRQRHEEVQG